MSHVLTDDSGRLLARTGEICEYKPGEEEAVGGGGGAVGRLQRGGGDEDPDTGTLQGTTICIIYLHSSADMR